MKKIFPAKAAQIIFGLIIGYFGLNYFINADTIGALVPDFMPGDNRVWIYSAAVCFVLAAIAIITGLKKRLAGYLLAFLLISIALFVHLKGMMEAEDENMKAIFRTNLLKDIALAMCAVIIAGNSLQKKIIS